jgi:hypothetical protein
MLASLAASAVCLAAAFAHIAIDIVGDYVLPHDSYDFIPHNSRDLVTAVGVAVAAVLALRGLRLCCDVAVANRARLAAQPIGKLWYGAFTIVTIVAAVLLVPAMEVLDGRLDGAPVKELDDAFGGSIALGLGTTVVCAAIVAVLVLAAVRWLVSHRDSIATILVSLVTFDRSARSASIELRRYVVRPPKRRTAPALRRCKRGPPIVAFVSP